MPHARLHGPDVGTRRDQQRRQIVPQTMEAETFGQRQHLVILGEVTLSLGDVDLGLAYGTLDEPDPRLCRDRWLPETRQATAAPTPTAVEQGPAESESESESESAQRCRQS